jgi:hypothetical protein
MRISLAIAFFVAISQIVSSASAGGAQYGPQGGSFGTSQPTYSGPGDIVSGATGWWGLRGYSAASAATAQPAALILRASDSTTATINILSNGTFDTATAATFCASTTCSVKTLYDQTGNGYNLTQATAANQPALLFNCFGFAPCLYFTGSASEVLVNSSFTNVAQPNSVAMVGERTANFTTEMDAFSALSTGYVGSVNGWWGVANELFSYAGSNSVYWTPFADSVVHGIVFVNNGASSMAYIDATSQTASQTPGTGGTYSTLSMGGNAAQSTHYMTGYMTEMGIWPTGMNSTQAGNIVANQQYNWR